MGGWHVEGRGYALRWELDAGECRGAEVKHETLGVCRTGASIVTLMVAKIGHGGCLCWNP